MLTIPTYFLPVFILSIFVNILFGGIYSVRCFWNQQFPNKGGILLSGIYLKAGKTR
jgi:hypothetical protein